MLNIEATKISRKNSTEYSGIWPNQRYSMPGASTITVIAMDENAKSVKTTDCRIISAMPWMSSFAYSFIICGLKAWATVVVKPLTAPATVSAMLVAALATTP